MFYDVTQAMQSCRENPSLIFELIKEEYYDVVDKILSKKYVDVNTCDENGNDVLSRLLKSKCYDLVLKYMSNKNWNVNHQNNDGDTFAHILVTLHYVNVVDIMKKLKKNKVFIPNIKNNKGETVLDKSINDHYIYNAVKVLEDARFNNIDVASFKNLYETYIKSDHYGRYSKLTNLETILDNLEDKPLLPRMEMLITYIKGHFDVIKKEVLNDNPIQIDRMIELLLQES